MRHKNEVKSSYVATCSCSYIVAYTVAPCCWDITWSWSTVTLLGTRSLSNSIDCRTNPSTTILLRAHLRECIYCMTTIFINNTEHYYIQWQWCYGSNMSIIIIIIFNVTYFPILGSYLFQSHSHMISLRSQHAIQ